MRALAFTILACGAAIPAQQLEIRGTMSGAPTVAGSTAFGCLREYGSDATTPMRLAWRAGAERVFVADLGAHAGPVPRDGSFHGQVLVDGRVVATATALADGRETWTFARGADVPARIREFATLLGIDAASAGTLHLDVAALLGALAGSTLGAEARGMENALLAGHCGELVLRFVPGPDALTLEGSSAGGITVPALLAWEAFLSARSARTGPFSVAESIVLRARALRASGREEAARQLARLEEPVAHDALLRLCRADDYTRVVAMESLARRGEPGDLGALVAAARPELPGSVGIARAAVLAHSATLPADDRVRLARQLAAHGAPELRAVTATLRAPLLAGSGSEPAIGDLAALRGPALVPLALGLVLLVMLLRRETARAAV